jgi:hypothetical protein
MSRPRHRIGPAAAAAFALAVGLGVAVPSSAEATDYCKRVTADTLSIFTTATGHNVALTLVRGEYFWAQRSDGPRYYGFTQWDTPGTTPSRQYGWVSNDPSWTNPC